MSFVSTKLIMDNVQTMIQDSSPTLRAKLLVWINSITKRLGAFPWACLEKEEPALDVAANAIELPADFYDVSHILVDGAYFTFDDEVTVRNSYLWAAGGDKPIGYMINGQKLKFVPGTGAATVELVYTQEVPNYLDSEDPMLFTIKFQPILERALLDTFYEADADPRGGQTVPFNPELMASLIASEVKNADIARKYDRFLKAQSAVKA